MARFTLFLSVATFLLLHPQSIWRAEAQDQKTPTSNTAAPIKCLKEMNDARRLAGLVDFNDGSASEETSVPIKDQNFVDSACLDAATLLSSLPLFPPKGSYAGRKYAVYAFAARKGSELDCAAAVNYWKSVFSNISSGGLPPPFSIRERFYQSPDNLSFLALFNPSGNPTIDCASITCPLKDYEAAEAQQAKQETKTSPPFINGYGISCFTSPDPYTEDKPPYTQQQWEKITQALKSTGEGSAPNGGAQPNEGSQPSRGLAPLPSFFAFAAAALAAALL